MRFETITATLISRLGERPDMAELIELELANTQERLENAWEDLYLPSFLLKPMTISLATGTKTIPLPGDFIREFNDKPLTLNGVELVKGFLDETDGDHDFCGPRYAIVGRYIVLEKALTDDGLLEGWMYSAQPKLSDSIQTNAWSNYAGELLIASTGAVLATFIRDSELAGIFSARENVERQKVIMSDIHKTEAAMPMEIRHAS